MSGGNPTSGGMPGGGAWTPEDEVARSSHDLHEAQLLERAKQMAIEAREALDRKLATDPAYNAAPAADGARGALLALMSQLIVKEAEHPGNIHIVDQRLPASVYDAALAASLRAPVEARTGREAIIEAFDDWSLNRKVGPTLSRMSPTLAARTAFEAGVRYAEGKSR